MAKIGCSDRKGIPVTSSDSDFDSEHDFDEKERVDDSVEACVWQLLVLINPGDEEMALQQFADYRDAVAQADENDVEPIEIIRRVIDWRSGFYVDGQDTRALVQAIDELSSRWNISIDWGGDPDDDDFHSDIDAASLFAVAYDRLLEHGYTLWAWEAEDDSYGGWITLKRDNEFLRELAISLGINMRLGSEVT
ncbi:hypothetical protein DWU99_15900 [Dyella psychrodurans]|uniref:DUF6630 domain-containing protein n=1 Tax=Dyella psychrodurans TaxID=1927960 RepID=A0A370X0V5_9GAMM|nr:hypothetical protein DWU99_15900 [Dyella psychrodurans]